MMCARCHVFEAEVGLAYCAGCQQEVSDEEDAAEYSGPYLLLMCEYCDLGSANDYSRCAGCNGEDWA